MCAQVGSERSPHKPIPRFSNLENTRLQSVSTKICCASYDIDMCPYVDVFDAEYDSSCKYNSKQNTLLCRYEYNGNAIIVQLIA